MHEDEHVVVTRSNGNGSSFPLGLIAGILIVILIVALIWYFGFGPGIGQPGGGVGPPSPVPPVNPY